MKFFRWLNRADAEQSPEEVGTAVMDGIAAAVQVERLAGSSTALAPGGCNAATRAARLWREDSGSAATPPLECTDEVAMVAAAAGMSEAGLRATAMLAGSGVLGAHEFLAGMAARQLPLVLHVFDQALQQSGNGDLPGQDAALAVADSGWFQFAAWDARSVIDLGIIARRLAEQLLLPGMVMQESWLVAQRAMNLCVAEPDAVAAFLGRPDDEVEASTAAQRMQFGETRRRVPALLDADRPLLTGALHREGSYAEQLVARQFYTQAAVLDAAKAAFAAWAAAGGRVIAPLRNWDCEDAQYLVVVQGSAVSTVRAVARQLRQRSGVWVGVVQIVMPHPLPEAELAALLVRKRAVLVLDRQTRQFDGDAPLLGRLRGVLARVAENSRSSNAVLDAGWPRLARFDELPLLHGAGYGIGGRELDPAQLIAAIEAMAAAQAPHPDLLLGVDLLPRQVLNPKHEIFAQQLADAAVQLRPAVDRNATTPFAPAEGVLTMHVFAPAGREPFSLDDHPGTMLHALAGLHVRAWPQPGRARRGATSMFTIVASHSPLDAMTEPATADITLATDATVFASARFAGSLRAGATLLLVADDAEVALARLAGHDALSQRIRGVTVLGLGADALARQSARDAASRAVARRRIIEGALLALPAVSALTRLEDRALYRELKSALLRADPQAPAEQLEAALALLRSGAEALQPLQIEAAAARTTMPAGVEPAPRAELRTLQPAPIPLADLHRHWESHPQFRGGDEVRAGTADPFLQSGVLPAASGLLRELPPRDSLPHWLAERCTGCGACWTVCPDSALVGSVNTPMQLLESGVRLLESAGTPTEHLPRAVRTLEGKWRARLGDAGAAAANNCLAAAAADACSATRALPEEQEAVKTQLDALAATLQGFPLARTSAFYLEAEATRRGSGGLLSITLDPDHCKACGACISVCAEQALESRALVPERLAELRRNWSIWHALPNSDEYYSRLGEQRSEAPRLETLLLDRRASRAVVGGNDADPGSAENTAIRLLAAAAESVMRPRYLAQAVRIDELASRLESHIRERLSVDLSDVTVFEKLLREQRGEDLSAAELWRRVDANATVVDTAWLARSIRTLSGLRELGRTCRADGNEASRSALMAVLAASPALAALASYPFNAFAFPCSVQAPGAAAAALLGMAEAQLARMAADFRLLRIAELELADAYRPELHDAFFAAFGWRQFSEEEWRLCPAMVLVADETMASASHSGEVLALLASGMPLKLLCLDAGSHARLAALPGTAPPFGEMEAAVLDAARVAPQLPLPLALLAAAQGEALVLQSGLADPGELMAAFSRGIGSTRAALFNVFRPDAPAPGQGGYAALAQSRLALRSRAHPALEFDPAAGEAPHQRLSLRANPQAESAWPTHTLDYLDEDGHAASCEVALSYAHFALALASAAHHFRAIGGEEAESTLSPLEQYLQLDAEECREYRPFIQAVDASGRLGRWAVSAALVEVSRQAAARWRLLRALTREDIEPVDEQAIANGAREEVADTVWRNLMALAQGDAATLEQALTEMAGPARVGEASGG